jgi:hypothetical protein
MQMVFKVSNKLKIYLSTSAIFPSKFNSEHVVYAKSVKIHAENGHIFTEQNVYLSVHSDEDQEISILVHFGGHQKQQIVRKAKEISFSIHDENFEWEYCKWFS